MTTLLFPSSSQYPHTPQLAADMYENEDVYHRHGGCQGRDLIGLAVARVELWRLKDYKDNTQKIRKSPQIHSQ